jgi:creatinine amidohydrolase/Fe(II)-dependent formamide hydrolase-like protein
MKYPGTISVTEATYASLLTDICASLRAHGFEHIVLIGDSGGNQEGMKKVAGELNARWQASGSRVHYIAQFYDYGGLAKWLQEQGIQQTPEGLHDDFAMTAMMMSVDPQSVRARQRLAAGKFTINGVDLAPAEKTIAWGKRIIDHRAEQTVMAIRAARGK